jgi:hypothetical protein
VNVKFCDAKAERPTLEEAQEFVGGYVQLFESRIYPKTQLLVDEDGLCKSLPINPIASRIAGTFIVGPALILSGEARWLPD